MERQDFGRSAPPAAPTCDQDAFPANWEPVRRKRVRTRPPSATPASNRGRVALWQPEDPMNEDPKTGFADRLKTAAAARTALLAKMRPKPTLTDPRPEERGAQRTAELEAVRQERTEAKTARKQAAADAVQAAEEARAAAEAAALDAKR